MILVISICKEKLHELEFVKPIEEILRKGRIRFCTKHYRDLKKKDIDNAQKIIICGTSLRDNNYLEHLGKFEWIKDYKKPVLGICGGMQVIGLRFGGKLKQNTEIGFAKIRFNKAFLGFDGEKEVYELHNYYVDGLKDLDIFAKTKFAQAIKHKKKEIYGVLFHPEVRQKEIVLNFAEK